VLSGNTLIFDIETVPDTEVGARIYDLGDLSEKDCAKAMKAKRIEKTGHTDFLPHHLHKIVAISVVLRSANEFRIWSIGDEQSSEKELLIRFFQGIEKFDPILVSWNGAGFDLPVIHYRSLLHSIPASMYWDVGDNDRNFRYNNFISRFHWRHIDLMDVLSGFQYRAAAPLHEVALMIGLPGKVGMKGSDVWGAYLKGAISAIRNYCETDVLNTYIIYLRFEQIRGNITEEELLSEFERIKTKIDGGGFEHLKEFVEYCGRGGAKARE
jgi:predicted PolB exonuclease-like 3'-5' exonuclease